VGKLQVKESWKAMKEWHWGQYASKNIGLLCGDFEVRTEWIRALEVATEHGVKDWFLENALTRQNIWKWMSEKVRQYPPRPLGWRSVRV